MMANWRSLSIDTTGPAECINQNGNRRLRPLSVDDSPQWVKSVFFKNIMAVQALARLSQPNEPMVRLVEFVLPSGSSVALNCFKFRCRQGMPGLATLLLTSVGSGSPFAVPQTATKSVIPTGCVGGTGVISLMNIVWLIVLPLDINQRHAPDRAGYLSAPQHLWETTLAVIQHSFVR